MDPKPLKWVLDAVGGAAAAVDRGVEISGVSTDTREVRPGDLFVAIEGDRFDGHEFVGEAFLRGASAALISRNVARVAGFRDRSVVRVADTRQALGRLAAVYRRSLGTEIVAVTGSNGKTTTKDMIAHVLEASGSVVKARKSFNNDIGVPLTLLAMSESTKFGVVEIGTNAPGEIAALSRIAQPDCGVVTNVGKAHLEGLGGLAGVAEEKAALVEALPSTGLALLNHEDYYCREMSRLARCPSMKFAFDPSADLWGLRRRRHPDGVSFFLYGKMEMFVPIPGLHNAMNALAAIGVAMRYGVSPAMIRERLSTFSLPEMRLRRSEVSGVTIINDAYNANPSSVTAAIEELRALPVVGRRILILGDMHELGSMSERLHRQMGQSAARAGIHQVWAVGNQAEEVGRGLASVSRWRGDFHPSPSTEDALRNIPIQLSPGDAVLVKGSRRMKLEQVHDRIVSELSEESGNVTSGN